MNSLWDAGKEAASYVGGKASQALGYLVDDGPDESFPEKAEGKEKPVPFKKGNKCATCTEAFSWQKYRKHCRNCGESYCMPHANNFDYVASYGYKTPVRTCDKCHKVLQEAAFARRIEYRSRRVKDFFDNKLEPFVEQAVDTGTEKTKRGAVAAVNVLKVAPGVGGVVQGVAAGADFLSKYGMAGAAGILMRNDFLAIVEATKEMMGDVKTMSMQDLSGGLYYMMAEKRRIRGSNPGGELAEHANCKELPDKDLETLLYYGHFACSIAYMKQEVDMQRTLQFLGYRLLFASVVSDKEQPAFFVAASAARKEVILSIRGTNSLHDVVTDLKVVPEKFAPGMEDVLPKGEAAVQEWEKTCNTHAHGGMGRAAMWLFQEVGACLEMFKTHKYKLVVTGHSLGAGCASLFSLINKPKFPTLECYAFATPSCADVTLCARAEPFVTTIVLHDDVVPRGTVHSLIDLLEQTRAWEQKWRIYFAEDYEAYKVRAKGVWTPCRRVEFVHSGEDKAKAADREKRRKELLEEVKRLEEAQLAKEREEKEKEANEAKDGGKISPDNQKQVDIFNDNPDASVEKVNKKDIPLLCPPGKIVHIYIDDCGLYRAAYVKNDHPSLRRIELFMDMADDHLGVNYMYSLRSIKNNRNANASPKKFEPFTARNVCENCEAKFTWTSTSDSTAQRALDTHNCRNCGVLVCPGCNTHEVALVQYGLDRPARICDRCFFSRL